MGYRLLVLDLDGTVMARDLSISPNVVRAISRARQHGVIVTIATGRVYNSAIQFLEQLGIDAPIICYQGALIRDPVSGKTIYEAGLSGDRAAGVVQRLRRDGIFVTVFHNDCTYAEHASPELDLYLSFHPGGEADVRLVSDLAGFARQANPIKLLFATDPDKLDELVTRLDAEFAGSVSVVRSHEYFGEVTASGVHKGSAIAKLAEHLGIDSSDVVAIGDERNDLPMIEWAGLGLAMGNAPEVVRSAAQTILPPLAEDGVVWAIERFILGGGLR